jgi:hypothetical protein
VRPRRGGAFAMPQKRAEHFLSMLILAALLLRLDPG